MTKEPSNKNVNTQTTIVNVKGKGFFSSLFSSMGGTVGCCIGILIILFIIGILASMANS